MRYHEKPTLALFDSLQALGQSLDAQWRTHRNGRGSAALARVVQNLATRQAQHYMHRGGFALGRARHLLLAVVRLGGYVGLLDRLRRVDGRADLVVGEHPLEDLLRARRVLRSHDDER